MKLKYKYFAIDFDNTITYEAEHPELGRIREGAASVLKIIKDHGGEISIWTCRCDGDEQRVKDFLREHRVPYDYFNEPFPHFHKMYQGNPRKICADVYIDDRALSLYGIEVDWYDILTKVFESEARHANNI